MVGSDSFYDRLNIVRIHVIPTPFYAANCVILVPDGSTTAVVVDPSAGVQDTIRQVLQAEKRIVGAVLCTHGHADHVWDAAAVSAAGFVAGMEESVAVYAPSPDLYRFEDPAAFTLALDTRIASVIGPWVKPDDLRPFPAGSVELIDGVWLLMVPAPGHTEGSAFFLGHSDVTMLFDGQEVTSSQMPIPWALSGDVLFAGSVGRTDLHGGDETQMRHSLRTLANAIDPQTFIIPGHGNMTTMAQELELNQYMARARQIG